MRHFSTSAGRVGGFAQDRGIRVYKERAARSAELMAQIAYRALGAIGRRGQISTRDDCATPASREAGEAPRFVVLRPVKESAGSTTVTNWTHCSATYRTATGWLGHHQLGDRCEVPLVD